MPPIGANPASPLVTESHGALALARELNLYS